MYTPIEKVTLKTNEELDIAIITGPEPEWKNRICSLLWHKGYPWTYHIEKALNGTIPDLDTRFYIGVVDSQAVANICLFEHEQVALLAHVYTRPEFRQRGIARHLNRVVMDDFRNRGGKAMTLGTDYDTHPFRLYESFGFKEILPEAGNMTCEIEPGSQENAFSPGRSVSVHDQRWSDWPHLNLLYHQTGGDWFRSVRHKLFKPVSYEGPFLAEHVEVEKSMVLAKTMVTDEGTAVGNLVCGSDPLWGNDICLLDFHLHENYVNQSTALLKEFSCTRKKVLSYARSDTYKEESLREAGFNREGAFSQLVEDGRTGERYDVVILSRVP